MKSYRKELWFNPPTRVAFIRITEQVNECLHESGVKEGLVLINAMHITASVFINDDERGLHHDYTPVSYTHLDVYKRQPTNREKSTPALGPTTSMWAWNMAVLT